MAYTVTVRATYRPGCTGCFEEAQRLAVGSLSDSQVTSITLVAAGKCEHEPPAALPAGHHGPLPGQLSLGVDDPTAPPRGFDS